MPRHCSGNGHPPKAHMYSDSRKAQRNSFAHHRAELLFAPLTRASDQRSAPGKGVADPSLARLRSMVRSGLIGFEPLKDGARV
jgi:hypothetical protein